MDSEIKLSVIVPAYNPGKKIIPCLKSVGKNLNYLSKNFNLTYEVLIINDAGNEINLNFDHSIKNIRGVRVKRNRGAGYARQFGARISKYNYLFYIDQDIVLENENSIKILFEEFKNHENVGSMGAVQNYKNLNKEFTSDFVSAKTCYGFESNAEIIEFSGMRSECGLMEKDFLNQIGGWKFLPNTGSEEFELGHRITANGKKNYITKKTNYTHFYDNLYGRCKTIIYRTSSYLPILFQRKKFESKGAFATFAQALSAFLTLLTLLLLFLSDLVDNSKTFIFILIFINLAVEFNFLKFALKNYNKKNILIYILGIYAINFSIMFGLLLGIFRLFSLKKLNIYLNK